MDLTLSHFLYGLFTLLIIGAMIMRKSIVLPALLGTFIIAFAYTGDLIKGFMAIFQANMTAATELFNIFLIITFMIALLHALRDLGADRRMVQPIQKFMKNGHLSFFILIAVTYCISLFFWPTPAVPLICALLVPAAVRAGLPPILAAVAVALAGQGMALSSDYIVQVAPGLSAKSAGVSTASVADIALILSIITGVTAIIIAYFLYRKEIRKPEDPINEKLVKKLEIPTDLKHKAKTKNVEKWSKLFSILVPVSLVGVVVIMLYQKFNTGRMSGFEGGDGAAFIGGVAVILLLLASLSYGREKALDYVADHITEGFVFAFKAMGPVIPIAGFFFLGSGEFAGSILGLEKGAPSFLFDLVTVAQEYIPGGSVLAAFGILLIGMITGLDGSGFSGLPLTGSLAQSMQIGNMDPSALAAIGQMGAIWTGGGTLIAWSSLIAIAGFCGVSAVDLVRKNFIPVMLGLLVSTIFAIWIYS